MAVYYSVKCPHCNNTVERGKDRQTHYGSPFKTCPRCKKTYVDKNYIEPGLLDTKDFKTFSWGVIPLAILGVFCFCLGITGVIPALIFGLLLIAFCVFIIVCNLKYDPEKDEDLQRKIKESKERLSDPHYVIALWKAECHITPEILQWAKKAIAEEEKTKIN